MSNRSTHEAWLDAETARLYHEFTAHTRMYQELSQEMVRLAQIQPGMRVLDLGCGTGVTTQAVLDVGGHVYAVDMSEPMLALARTHITASQATFIHADAADIATHITEPVDRVVCNSVFWQLEHKPHVLAAVYQVLKPHGTFIFNVPEPYFIFKDIPRSTKFNILFEQLAAERHGVGRQDLRTMRTFLASMGFDLLQTHHFERVRPAQESYLFMQLPVATAWMDPPLDYDTRQALIEEAWQAADAQQATKQRWMYFVVQPTQA